MCQGSSWDYPFICLCNLLRGGRSQQKGGGRIVLPPVGIAIWETPDIVMRWQGLAAAIRYPHIRDMRSAQKDGWQMNGETVDPAQVVQ